MGSHSIYFILFFGITWVFWYLYCNTCFSNSWIIFYYIDTWEFLIYLPADDHFILFFSNLGLLQTKLLWIAMHGCLHRHVFLFLLGNERRGYKVGLGWTILKSMKLFSIVAVPCCIPTTRYESSSFPHLCQHLVW